MELEKSDVSLMGRIDRVMKYLKYVLMISIVASLTAIRLRRFSPAEILRTANCIPTFRSARNRLVGHDKQAKDLPATGSGVVPARALGPAEIARTDSDRSDGSVEEYRETLKDTDNQGSGYGDVFDSNGHLLWRFAVLEHGNSQWTILKYFSEPISKRRNFEPAQTPQLTIDSDARTDSARSIR